MSYFHKLLIKIIIYVKLFSNNEIKKILITCLRTTIEIFKLAYYELIKITNTSENKIRKM